MILKTLSDFGKKATSRIAGIVGIDYNYAIKLLTELEKEKFIKSEDLGSSKYWEITEKGKREVKKQ